MKRMLRTGICLLILSVAAKNAVGQASPFPAGDVKKTYERLLKKIDAIPMYDNHAHPGYPDDNDVDAMASPPGRKAQRFVCKRTIRNL